MDGIGRLYARLFEMSLPWTEVGKWGIGTKYIRVFFIGLGLGKRGIGIKYVTGFYLGLSLGRRILEPSMPNGFILLFSLGKNEGRNEGGNQNRICKTILPFTEL